MAGRNQADLDIAQTAIQPHSVRLRIARCVGGDQLQQRGDQGRIFFSARGRPPPGASKWNPIDHRLFSEISKTWAGCPLRTWERMLDLIRATRTDTGLRVEARRNQAVYPTGIRVSDAEMAQLNIVHHVVCPQWNYTLRPRPAGARALAA
jgi:hypothetical protein